MGLLPARGALHCSWALVLAGGSSRLGDALLALAESSWEKTTVILAAFLLSPVKSPSVLEKNKAVNIAFSVFGVVSCLFQRLCMGCGVSEEDVA